MNTKKIKLFFEGRKGLLPKIEAACGKHRDIIWFHVASYGEFEEARPVIEATRARFPERKILMTVFSPTVYLPMQHYPMVDWVFYLPYDTPWHVRRFLDAVRPSKAIFTITDYWPVLLNALRRRKVDTYIMSVRVEPQSHHLKWYDWNYRQLFRHCYKTVMVHNEESGRLLRQLGAPDVRVMGDPRLDRVISVATEEWSNPVVEKWAGGKKVFVAGSTLDAEDAMLMEISARHPEGKFLIIPHEIDPAKVEALLAKAAHGAVKYTDYLEKETDERLEKAQILIMDTVGMLSRLYRYGYAALVGGGFTDNAPHSVVEPASYGMPVVFGPVYDREPHGVELVRLGGAFSVNNLKELEDFYLRCKRDKAFLEESSRIAKDYCARSTGATQNIMEVIFG